VQNRVQAVDERRSALIRSLQMYRTSPVDCASIRGRLVRALYRIFNATGNPHEVVLAVSDG